LPPRNSSHFSRAASRDAGHPGRRAPGVGGYGFTTRPHRTCDFTKLYLRDTGKKTPAPTLLITGDTV
jgi:hypothetical protein